MTTKKSSIIVRCSKGGNVEKAKVKTLSQPETQAALTIEQYKGYTGDVNLIAEELKEQSKIINSGNLERPEQVLIAHAHTLDVLFNDFARKAALQDRMSTIEGFLKLALRAQNQCRMTLETLNNIKNPPVVYARQANFAQGPQQINNSSPSTHTAEIQNQQNKLLEKLDDECLDTGTTRETVGSSPEMATLEKFNGSTNENGQG